MTRKNRQRRLWFHARWTAAAIALLAFAIGIFSTRWHTGWNYYRTWAGGLTRAAIIIERFDPPLPAGSRLGGFPADGCHIRFFRQDPGAIFWPKWRTSSPPAAMTQVILPLWLPTLIFGALSLKAHQHIRRLDNVGKCTKCGYNLAGLKDQATCPECGQSIQTPRPLTPP